MKIYLLRHGQTDWNKDKRLSCSNEAQLNERGIEQAEEAAKLLENINYDLVISSPYTRARKTAEIANKNRATIIIDDRLKERKSGVLDGRFLTEIDSELEDFSNYYKNAEFEGAENIHDFCDKVWSFLDDIKIKYKDKTLLIVTHRLVIRSMKAYILGVPESGSLREYKLENCGLEEHDI